MVEVWDLARHVEAHPDEHEQRWRLAKKLYAAWEYRLALEHLEVLKHDWAGKVNVLRYLSATYYRLGRYDEACSELRDAIDTWPEEMALREQLARVLEVAGRREAAADVWDQVLEVDPEHPFAAKAAKRLRKRRGDTPQEALNLGDSDSGIDLSVGRPCPNCGAQNSAEFDRCWQCHTRLRDGAAGTPAPSKTKFSFPRPSPASVAITSGLVIAGLAVCGLYLTVRQWGIAFPPTGQPAAPLTVYGYLTNTFLVGRLVTGLAGAVAWPLVLWLSFALLGLIDVRWPPLIAGGVFLATLTYALFWLPPRLMLLAPSVVAVLSFFVVAGLSGWRWGRAVGVWLSQGLLMAVILAGTFMCFTGFDPVKEAGAIVRYAARHDADETPGVYASPSIKVPFGASMEWKSTGSPWLDERGRVATITVKTSGKPNNLLLEFGVAGGAPRIELLDSARFTISQPITPDQTYVLVVKRFDPSQREGQDEVEFEVSGLIDPNVGFE